MEWLSLFEFAGDFDSVLFHFLRPQWLWGLLVLLPLAFWALRARHSAGAWKQWVDPELQALVLTQGRDQRQWHKQLWLAVAWALACLALAGPTWQQQPSPLLRSDQARIVVLDLSRSMLANDLKPSRLELARLKVRDILQQSRDSKAGLVAFAAQAFPIAPLTDDIQTLLSQVPTLHPDLMPAQGGRVDRALQQAQAMLSQGGAGTGGQVVLVTDSKPQEAAFAAAQALRDAGYELSVLAVGTAQGAPIPEDERVGRGFVKDRSGSIVIAKLPMSELRQLALAGGGRFSVITADDRDIQKLNKVLEHDGSTMDESGQAKAGDQWIEAGPLLLLLLIPLVAIGFRRGWLMALVLVVGLPSPMPAYAEGGATNLAATASEPASSIGSKWWFNDDQRGYQALQADKAEEATQLFKSDDWKAAAEYRAGEAQAAADYWAQQETPEAAYNWGNALAQAGDLPAAIEAWKSVPEDHALFSSAQENAELMQKLLDQQQSDQDQQDGDGDQEQGDEGEDGEQSQDDSQSQNQPQDGESGDPSDQEQENASEQSSQEASSEQPQDSRDEAEDESQGSESKPDESEEDQQAAAQNGQQGEENDEQDAESLSMTPEELAEEQAREQVIEQWLNRVPDDPGGLLREKFKRDYQRRSQQRGSEYQDEDQAW